MKDDLCENWTEAGTEDVQEKWERREVEMKEVAQELCRMKCVGRTRNGTDWQNEELE